MRVAPKPAFAVVVWALAFLAQDIFTRVSHVAVTNDESVAFTFLVAALAYWFVPADKQT